MNDKKLLAMEWVALNIGLTLMVTPIVVFLLYAFTWVEVFPTGETGMWMFLIGLGMFLSRAFVQPPTQVDKTDPNGSLVADCAIRATLTPVLCKEPTQ